MSRVTIIVRTFRGRERLLMRALESIRGQKTEHPIDIIVAIDGQPIDTDGIDLSQFGAVTVVYAGHPGGRSAAANAGLDAATGDLIGFLDDDDWLETEHVEKLAGLLADNPGAAAAYAAAWEQEATLDIQDPLGSTLGRKTLFYKRARNSLDLLSRNLFPIQAILFRRGVLSSSGARFATELDALEDWLFWQRLLIGELLVHTPDVTSTFHMPIDPAVKELRQQGHRDAFPVMLELRRSIRVPVAVAHELADMRRGDRATAKRQPASLRSFFSARLEMLQRKRPKLRHKIEYFIIRAVRKLWRMTPRGRAELVRLGERRANAARSKSFISTGARQSRPP